MTRKRNSLSDVRADGGCWPTELDCHLLTACLSEDPAVVRDAYKAWRPAVDINDLPQGHYRLLPLLAKALDREGVRDPSQGIMHGVHKVTWARNQVNFAHLAPLAEQFAALGHPLMLLKGAAMITGGYYASPGLRPMSDLDLLLKPEAFRPAMDILKAAGYTPRDWVDREGLDQLSQRRHAFPMYPPDDSHPGYDLHFVPFLEDVGLARSNALWEQAEPATVHGKPVLLPSPTDLLLHTIAHGTIWNDVMPIRWVPDSMMILRRRGGDIDWDHFQRSAIRHQIVARTCRALSFLHGQLAAPIPPAVLAAFEKERGSMVERIENRFNQDRMGILGDLPLGLCRLVRMYSTCYPTRRAAIADFPAQLRCLFRVDRGASLPGTIAVKGCRFVGRLAGLPRRSMRKQAGENGR